MRLVGLAGYAGVGKDTVARILAEEHGFRPFSFSDTLYPEVSTAFGVDIGWLQDRAVKDSPRPEMAFAASKEEKFADLAAHVVMGAKPGDTISLKRYVEEFRLPRTPRLVLQLWGTEYRRAQDPAYWVKKAEEFVNRAWAPPLPFPSLVNTSVRFPNEVAFIRRCGGEVWNVVRHIERPNDHIAEKGLEESMIDRTILNTGTLDELRTLLRDITWENHGGDDAAPRGGTCHATV